MGVLCFVADLPTLPPESLRRLKQCWLQLANYYAVASPPPSARSIALGDRIALCYVFFDRIASSHHLKVAYSPGESFDLCGFHRAIESMPVDAFLPDPSTLSSCDVKLPSLLSDESIYSWSSEDVARKIVVITSSLPPEMHAALHDSLMDAADRCVSVEFLLFVARSIHLQHMQENMSKFVGSISDLDNCSVSACLPDARVLDGMTKRWLQYVTDQVEESMQARFIFKNDLAGAMNQISCNLSISSYQLFDDFGSCQTGNWHEIIKEEVLQSKTESDLKLGEGRILLEPSLPNSMKSQLVCSPIDFKVIERTNLSSLSEGVLIGTPHVAIPSSGPEIGTASSGNNLELNNEVFQGLCWVLQSLDQGLVCSSTFNMETMKASIFPCYYILQPSDYGPMLLRRLAGLEEILPLPSQYLSCCASKETEDAIKASIFKMESRDYDPTLHDRGFHQRMNLLVQQRSERGSLPLESKETFSESKSSQAKTSDVVIPVPKELTLEIPVAEAEPPHSETKCTAAEEWAQLLVNEMMPNMPTTPTCTSELASESPQVTDLSPVDVDGLARNDAKISRILERLEAPRQSNAKPRAAAAAAAAASPTIAGKSRIDPCCSVLTTKNPPRLTRVAEQGHVGNQLIKPSFNLKRKRQ